MRRFTAVGGLFGVLILVQASAVRADAAPAYEEIKVKSGSLTDAQWGEYAKALKGKSVDWSGTVTEVHKKLFGGYEVWLDMDPPGTPLSVQDVYVPVSDSQALGINKGQSLAVRGTIKSVTRVLGKASIHLDKGASVN
jgi:hypothetical protein